VHIPREQRIYDLTEEEKTCHCGEKMTHIKNEKCAQLEIIPAKVFVIEHLRMKCLPADPTQIASPGLLSHVLVSKYQGHLPLHRQK
jgi:transposase